MNGLFGAVVHATGSQLVSGYAAWKQPASDVGLVTMVSRQLASSVGDEDVGSCVAQPVAAIKANANR